LGVPLSSSVAKQYGCGCVSGRSRIRSRSTHHPPRSYNILYLNRSANVCTNLFAFRGRRGR
jgi:hypothetical protein